MAARLNSVASKGSLNRAHTYEAVQKVEGSNPFSRF
jgi:hypothetical protein